MLHTNIVRRYKISLAIFEKYILKSIIIRTNSTVTLPYNIQSVVTVSFFCFIVIQKKTTELLLLNLLTYLYNKISFGPHIV